MAQKRIAKHTLDQMYEAYIEQFNKTKSKMFTKYGTEPFAEKPKTKVEVLSAVQHKINTIEANGGKPSSKIKLAQQVARSDVYYRSQSQAQKIHKSMEDAGFTGKKLPSITAIRSMTPEQLGQSEFYKAIQSDYDDLKEKFGYTGKDAGRIIAEVWFGSK